MSDDKCPKCGTPKKSGFPDAMAWECGSYLLTDGTVIESYECRGRQLAAAQAIIEKLPQDVEGNPIVEGATYWRRCANGAYPVYAYLSPRTSPAKPYSWERCYPTEVAAKAAAEAAK